MDLNFMHFTVFFDKFIPYLISVKDRSSIKSQHKLIFNNIRRTC